MAPVLEFAGVTVRKGRVTLLDDIDWTVEEDELRAVVTFEAPDAGGGDVPPSVSVTREALPSPSITLEAYAEAGTRQLEQAVPGFMLVSEGAATLGGLPAKRIEYTGTQAELELHWQQVFAVADGAAFLTEAFRAFGSLAADNAVARITRLEPCPGGSTGAKP